MEYRDELIKISDILEKVAHNQLDENTALNELERTPNYKIVNRAVHHLHHFSADEDIRSLDPEYDKAQRKELLHYAEQIRKLAESDQGPDPEIKRVPRGIRIAVVSIASLLLFKYCSHQLAIDTCLDRGGRWNYEIGECEGARQ